MHDQHVVALCCDIQIFGLLFYRFCLTVPVGDGEGFWISGGGSSELQGVGDGFGSAFVDFSLAKFVSSSGSRRLFI